jgi:hypothetical protein
MPDKLNIRVTANWADGLAHRNYRARVNSSNVISTCTEGPEPAAEAALARWNKSGKLTTAWTLREVDHDQSNIVKWWQFEATPAAETDGTAEPAGTAGTAVGNGSETLSEGGAGGTGNAVPPAIPQSLVVLSPEVIVTTAAAAPGSLEACTEAIRELIQTGRRAAARISILLAGAHDSYFKEESGKWLEWAQNSFGYERRFCFTCLKAGQFLSVQHAALDPKQREKLAATDLTKLEDIAKVPPHLLAVFLKKHDPAACSRDQVKLLAKCYAKNRTAGEIAAEEAKAEAAAAAKIKAKAEKSSRAAGPNPGLAIQTLVSLLADNTAMNVAAMDLDHMAAIQAGFCALQLALIKLECGGALTAAQFAVAEKLAAQFGHELANHKPQE